MTDKYPKKDRHFTTPHGHYIGRWGGYDLLTRDCFRVVSGEPIPDAAFDEWLYTLVWAEDFIDDLGRKHDLTGQPLLDRELALSPINGDV